MQLDCTGECDVSCMHLNDLNVAFLQFFTLLILSNACRAQSIALLTQIRPQIGWEVMPLEQFTKFYRFVFHIVKVRGMGAVFFFLLTCSHLLRLTYLSLLS